MDGQKEVGDQPNAPRTMSAQLQGSSAPDFKLLIESRIKQLAIEQRDLQAVLDGLPSKLPAAMNQALVDMYFRAQRN